MITSFLRKLIVSLISIYLGNVAEATTFPSEERRYENLIFSFPLPLRVIPPQASLSLPLPLPVPFPVPNELTSSRSPSFRNELPIVIEPFPVSVLEVETSPLVPKISPPTQND